MLRYTYMVFLIYLSVKKEVLKYILWWDVLFARGYVWEACAASIFRIGEIHVRKGFYCYWEGVAGSGAATEPMEHDES